METTHHLLSRWPATPKKQLKYCQQQTVAVMPPVELVGRLVMGSKCVHEGSVGRNCGLFVFFQMRSGSSCSASVELIITNLCKPVKTNVISILLILQMTSVIFRVNVI